MTKYTITTHSHEEAMIYMTAIDMSIALSEIKDMMMRYDDIDRTAEEEAVSEDIFMKIRNILNDNL